MVYLSLDESVGLSGRDMGARLEEKGVRVGAVGRRRFRLVTHYWIGDAQVEAAVAAFTQILASL
jgi:threonine aldolase